jgi:hypothetical protein
MLAIGDFPKVDAYYLGLGLKHVLIWVRTERFEGVYEGSRTLWPKMCDNILTSLGAATAECQR